MRHVLIVDDSLIIQKQLEELLKEVSDIAVDCASDERRARELIDANRYDLALVDIELGSGVKAKLAGLGLTTQLTAKGCIVLVVSGTADDTLKGVAAYLSGYDFVSKPINPIDLINKVEHALHWAGTKHLNDDPLHHAWPMGLERDSLNPMKLRWKGKAVNLTLTQLSMVHMLAESADKVVDNRALAGIMKTGQGTGALATHISNIRKAFRESADENFDEIHYEPGKGYCWKTA